MSSPAVAITPPDRPAGPNLLAEGGGEMGRRVREFDWAVTPLGAPAVSKALSS